MKNYLFKEVYSEDRVIKNGTISVNGEKFGKISSVGEDLDSSFASYRAIPGIIDVHNHGFMGWSATTQNPEDVIMYARSLASKGVTGVLATTMVEGAIRTVAEVMDKETGGAEILGIHSEGPFISLEKKGAFKPETIRKPDINLAERLYEAGRGKIKYITVAPDYEGAEELIRWWTDKGVIVSAGHSNVYAAGFNESVGWGVRSTTHLGNGMRGMHQRDAGVFGAALINDSVHVELICDFFHVCQDMVELVLRAKDNSKILIISDSGELAGLSPGKYICRDRLVNMDENGFLRLEDGTISGSSKFVLYGISNIVNLLKRPLEDVLKMTSLNQAGILGIEDKKGSIKEGKDCDFVVIDDNFDVIATYVKGKMVYSKNDGQNLVNSMYKPVE